MKFILTTLFLISTSMVHAAEGEFLAGIRRDQPRKVIAIIDENTQFSPVHLGGDLHNLNLVTFTSWCNNAPLSVVSKVGGPLAKLTAEEAELIQSHLKELKNVPGKMNRYEQLIFNVDQSSLTCRTESGQEFSFQVDKTILEGKTVVQNGEATGQDCLDLLKKYK